jgi:hypothetical protein
MTERPILHGSFLLGLYVLTLFMLQHAGTMLQLIQTHGLCLCLWGLWACYWSLYMTGAQHQTPAQYKPQNLPQKILLSLKRGQSSKQHQCIRHLQTEPSLRVLAVLAGLYTLVWVLTALLAGFDRDTAAADLQQSISLYFTAAGQTLFTPAAEKTSMLYMLQIYFVPASQFLMLALCFFITTVLGASIKAYKPLWMLLIAVSGLYFSLISSAPISSLTGPHIPASLHLWLSGALPSIALREDLTGLPGLALIAGGAVFLLTQILSHVPFKKNHRRQGRFKTQTFYILCAFAALSALCFIDILYPLPLGGFSLTLGAAALLGLSYGTLLSKQF